LDNFSTGKQQNIDRLLELRKDNFIFIKGDICNLEDINICFKEKIDAVVHLAAQISVQKSFIDINHNNRLNIDGFVNVLRASGINKVLEFIYVSSCSVYGNANLLPITENQIPDPLSPYASSKLMNEYLAKNLSHIYPDTNIIGFRLFNLFGPWQDPFGDYAAVIPKWINLCMEGKQPIIYGDGNATRDFCYVENVCNMILEIGNRHEKDLNGIYNIGSGQSSSLNDLYNFIISSLSNNGISMDFEKPIYKPWREGDIIHSLGSIDLAIDTIGFDPKINLEMGISKLLKIQYGLSL
jgi:UDP-N-acetylglucosamine/UDP-N-acetylgalactosamine 4-epimerase